MNGQFYINPTTLLVKNGEHYELRAGSFAPVLLNEEVHSKFIESYSLRKPYSLEEILSYFTVDEAFTLFRRNAFIDGPVDMEARYSRNECFFLLNNEPPSAFEELTEKNVLILGAGCVGTHIIWAFSAVGIKNITVLDFDIVEASNLNRQLMYEEADIGKPKLEAVSEHISRLNSSTELSLRNIKIENKEQVDEILSEKEYDLVMIAIDSPPEVRHWINALCVKYHIPYVTGGFEHGRGMVGITYIPDVTPCFDCFEGNDLNQVRLLHGTGGATLAPITEYVAAKMSMEGLNILRGIKSTPYSGKYELYHFRTNSSEIIEDQLRLECTTCGRKDDNARPKDYSMVCQIFLLLCALIPFTGFMMPDKLHFTVIPMLVMNLMLLAVRKHTNIFEVSFCGSVIFAIAIIIVIFTSQPIILSGPNYVAVIAAYTFGLMAFISLCVMAFLIFLYILDCTISRFGGPYPKDGLQ